MANNDANADKMGLISIVNHDAIVEPHAKPVCSPRVIVLFDYGWNGRFAIFRIGIRYAERLSVLGVQRVTH
jgi:hypothetical protein